MGIANQNSKDIVTTRCLEHILPRLYSRLNQLSLSMSLLIAHAIPYTKAHVIIRGIDRTLITPLPMQ